MRENSKTIYGDNTGENKILGENYMKNLEEIKFQFTSPSTPQKSNMV